MVTTERTWAVLPTAQWAQLKMGRLVVPGWGLKSAMIGLVTAKSTVRSPTIGWAPPRAIGSNPLFSMTTKRRPRREKNTVKLINSLNKIIYQRLFDVTVGRTVLKVLFSTIYLWAWNHRSLPPICFPTQVCLKYLAKSIPMPAKPSQATTMKRPCSCIKMSDLASSLPTLNSFK